MINRDLRSVNGFSFSDIIMQIAEIYGLSVPERSINNSVGFYKYSVNEVPYVFYAWQDAIAKLIDFGVPINLSKSYKSSTRYTLVMTEDIPEIKKERTDNEQEEGERVNTPEMDEDRVKESIEGTDKENETTKEGSTRDGASQHDTEIPGETVRGDFENIPWKTMKGPRFSKDQIIALAKEFGISLGDSPKKELISSFEAAVNAHMNNK